MPPLNILISGSGIAGSVFASWLLRAYSNAQITIVERATALRMTGASVDIRNSAVDIIEKMGVEQEIRNRGTNASGIQYVASDGSPIATLEATGRTDVQSITSEYEIFRGELAKIFMQPIQDRVQLIFDDFVNEFKDTEDGVTVTFSKSGETKRYDLLVAADGMGSKIRSQMLGRPSREQVFDEGVHVAYFTMKSNLLGQSKLAKWYNAPGGRVVFLRPDPHPAGRVRANLMNVRWRSDTIEGNRLDAALEGGKDAYMDLMDDQFRDAGWVSPEVLQGMRESDDFYCSLFAQTRVPNLFKGRVVLLGDAGYAVPGLGTSLAIMGGYILAGELLKDPNDLTSALQRYEDTMLPFAKSQQSDDIAMQLLNPQTQWGIGLRNTALRIVIGLRIDKVTTRAVAWLGITDKKLQLLEYQWLSYR
ncbi:hypothetical protein BDZ85DRAFT_261289 [Elsinoe ampelina]|uniref:FAD-binding domain-containing protein n=1 Tax=Elsinoe ampelina TaxID=302913 RepID=A0A6A6GC17_9PEZI|nr:hypothetical protein BDZ85DRAFT_261289 [Elsinoe ampelina]